MIALLEVREPFPRCISLSQYSVSFNVNTYFMRPDKVRLLSPQSALLESTNPMSPTENVTSV